MANRRMGKVRLKLSDAIPEVWCKKVQEVGGTQTVGHSKGMCERFAEKRADTRVPRQQASVFSTGNKAIYFSSREMQRRRSSPYADLVGIKTSKYGNGKDVAICTVIDPKVSAGCICGIRSVVSLRKAKGIKVQAACTTSGTSILSLKASPSNKPDRLSCCGSEHNVKYTMGAVTDAKANKNHNDGSRTSCDDSICFDARELERRLRNLGFEERRTYYTDWSSGFSSPEIDTLSQKGYFPYYSYGDQLGEGEKFTRVGPYIGSKLFDKISSSESDFKISASPSGNELDCRTSFVGNNEFSSFPSDESLFTTVDESHTPLLKCICGLSRKEHTCLLSDVDRFRSFFGAEISNGAFHSRKNKSIRQKLHDKASKRSRYSKSKEYDMKGRHEFTKCSELLYETITNSSEDFVNCQSRMKSVNESRDNHILNHGGGAGSRGFSYSECKARLLSCKSNSQDYSDFNSFASDPEILHGAAETFAQQNSKNILSSYRLGDWPSSQNFGTDEKSELISVTEIMKGSQELHVYGEATRAVKQKKGNGPQEFSSDVHSRVYDSVAMVKCSSNPQKDFKDSMKEMVLEKELHTSEDLEDLLECYLSLNSETYHDTILRAFGEVSTEIFQERL